jgi:RNA polymerase sigma factor (sigma-70 family)
MYKSNATSTVIYAKSDAVHDAIATIERKFRPSRSSAPAEDVIQEAFLRYQDRILQNPSRELDSKETLRSYRNTAKTKRRQEKKRLEREVSLSIEVIGVLSPHLRIECPSNRIVIEMLIIETLPADLCRILQLHLEGWSAQEIATELSISRSTVQRKLAQARKILWKKLKEAEVYSRPVAQRRFGRFHPSRRIPA